MRKKAPDVFLLAGFMLMIGLPLFEALPSLKYIINEYQSSQARLTPGQAYLKFSSGFSDPFEDYYFSNNWHVELFQLVRIDILGDTVFPNVIIGKDDWLFFTGDNSIVNFQCMRPYSAGELDTIRQNFLDWNDQLEQRGIDFYIVIAPNKEEIYPQYLPDWLQPQSTICRIDQIIQELQTVPQLTVLYPRNALLEAARSTQVYSRTDTHWNDAGALVAASEILALISLDHPAVKIPSSNEFQPVSHAIKGDLAKLLSVPGKRFAEQNIALVPLDSPARVVDEKPDRTIIITEIPNSSLPRGIVFGDSFVFGLIPFLSEQFSRVLYVFPNNMDFDLIDREKPDIVIYEVVQRNLSNH